jgi:hypothetical protein
MSRLSLALVFTVILAACGDTASPAPAVPPPGTPAGPAAQAEYPGGVGRTLGVSATGLDLDASAESVGVRKELIAAGFRIVRFDVLWQDVETVKGVYDWAAVDARIDGLLAAGFEPLVLLAYGNPLYYDEFCPQADGYVFACTGADAGPFAAFAGAAAARYGGRVKHFEIWNEPNGWFRFWPQANGGDPRAYARLLARATAAVHEACADCTVVSGGMVYLETPITNGQARFMRVMNLEVPGIFRAVDGVGVHEYSWYPPIDPPEAANGLEVPYDAALSDVRANCSCGDAPLWITEVGWTAVAGSTEADRARYGVRAWLMSLPYGIESWLWWSARDLDVPGLINAAEGHFGLFAWGGAPHPVFASLARASERLGAAVTAADVRAEYGLRAPAEWAVRFTFRDGRTADVVWYGGRGEGPAVAALAGKQGVNLITGATVAAATLGADPVFVTR